MDLQDLGLEQLFEDEDYDLEELDQDYDLEDLARFNNFNNLDGGYAQFQG